MREHFQIYHTTIQFEQRDEAGCEVEDGCLSLAEESMKSRSRAHGHSHSH